MHLTDDTVRLVLDSEIVVNKTARQLSAYNVSVISGEGDISVRGVLLPKKALTTSEIILVVDKSTHGTHYRVTASGLTGRDGSLVTASSDFVARRTKIEDLHRSLPNHYDMRAGSDLWVILTAVGIEDELIGGSGIAPDVGLNILLLEDGEPLLQEDSDFILLE